MAITDFVKHSLTYTKELFRRTRLEVYLGATLGLAAASTFSLKYEYRREQLIPLAFSEIHQIEDDAKEKGEMIGHINHYLAQTNDLLMKIFEASDKSYIPPAEMPSSPKAEKSESDSNKKFALELRRILDPNQPERHHYTLSDLFNLVPEQAEEVKKELEEQRYLEARSVLPSRRNDFSKAWTERHRVNTHSELRTSIETHTDSQGHTYTTTETHWETVYDNTDHYYYYHKEDGEIAFSRLDSLISDILRLQLNEKIRAASHTHEQNQWAISLSRRNSGKENPELTEGDYVGMAMTWRRASILLQYLTKAENNWESLKNGSSRWRVAKEMARDEHYNTISRTHEGPEGYQICKSIESDSNEFCSSIDQAVKGVNFTQTKIPELSDKVNKYLGVVLYGEAGNPRKLRNEIMDLAKEVYNQNYQGGLDVNGFRAYIFLLWSAIGVLVGMGAGFGWDKLGEKYLWPNRERGSGRVGRYHFRRSN